MPLPISKKISYGAKSLLNKPDSFDDFYSLPPLQISRCVAGRTRAVFYAGRFGCRIATYSQIVINIFR